MELHREVSAFNGGGYPVYIYCGEDLLLKVIDSLQVAALQVNMRRESCAGHLYSVRFSDRVFLLTKRYGLHLAPANVFPSRLKLIGFKAVQVFTLYPYIWIKTVPLIIAI